MREKMRRLAAALLVCMLVLAGCGGENRKDSGNSGETGGGDGGVTNEELLKKLEELEAQVAQLQAGLTLPSGILFEEAEELTDSEAAELTRIFAEQEEYLLAVPPSGEQVKVRDWSRYTTPNATRGLNSAEAAFYAELDDLCMTYLTNPGHYVDQGSFRYISQAANFQELGLTREQAYNVWYWFKYNNPQYYFAGGTAHNSSQMFVMVYDFTAELEDEAKATNEMFDKLDSWIASCCDDEATTWDKLAAANRLICESTIYSPAVKQKVPGAAGGMNQSIYSVLMSPETVCAGYAITFQAMANAMGIDTYTVLSDTHAWNAARFDDGKYYFVDVCWNDEDNGYNENYLGVGTGYLTQQGAASVQSHTYKDSTAAFSPDIPAGSYDNAAAAPDAAAGPNLRVGGAGSAVAKVEWDPVNGAEAYEYWVYNGPECLTALRVKADTGFVYVSFPAGADSLTVRVRAVTSANGTSAATRTSELTVSPPQAGSAPPKPDNVRVEHPAGVRVRWDAGSGVSSWLFIGYGSDSTMTVPWIKYTLDSPTIGWTGDWQPEEDTYFRVMAIRRSGGSEIYSDPVDLKYNIHDGMTLLETPAAGEDGVQTQTYSDGGVYVGELKDGERHGYGTYTYPSGNVYEGEWKDGKRDGYGKFTWASGDVYEGEWKDGKRNGQGRQEYSDGAVYDGEWKNGGINGYGTYTWANGNVYEGDWKNAGMTGYGTFTWADGSVYEGEFVDGKKDGHGILLYASGHVFEGEFKDDKRNGHGKYTWADGGVREGEWKDDQFVD